MKLALFSIAAAIAVATVAVAELRAAFDPIHPVGSFALIMTVDIDDDSDAFVIDKGLSIGDCVDKLDGHPMYADVVAGRKIFVSYECARQ